MFDSLSLSSTIVPPLQVAKKKKKQAEQCHVPRGGSVFALERSVTTKIGGMKSFFQPNQLGQHAGFSCLNLRKEVDEFCTSLSHTYPNI